MKHKKPCYDYQFNGRDGTCDIVEIMNPKGAAIATLYYQDRPNTDDVVRVASSARVICQHLNRWRAKACHAAFATASNACARTTQQATLCTPWSLHLDRDGTEDFAVIYDANEDELACSRFFCLPESGDPIPTTLAAMLLMVAAPRMFEALKAMAEQADEDCPPEYRSRHFADALEQANTVLAETTEWSG